MRDRERAAAALFAAVLVAALSGCASRPVNVAIREQEPYSPAQDHDAGRGDHTLALVLAFSGGGTRAAAFSFGVLEELRRTRLSGPPPRRMLDEVDTIMGISGGSFTALSYALYGERLFDEYEAQFLKRDVQGHLIGSVLNPIRWPALASPAYGRSDESMDVIEHNATFRELVGVNRLRRLAIVIVNSRADPPRDWDQSESGPGIVGQLLKASGVPIDRYSYEQVELLKDMIDRWALMRDRSRLAGLEGWPADPSLTELPKMEFYAIDVSFERIADPERRRRFMSLPTSFVLPPADVDALREVAGELLRENAVYQKLVRDLGGTVPR